jgi:Tfp pilus assembly protein FimT
MTKSKVNWGFTLNEFLVALAIVIVLASISVLSYGNIRPALQLNGAARNLVSDLRYAQQLAVTEQFDHGAWFSTTSKDKYQIIRHQNSATTTIKEVILEEEGIELQQMSPFTNNEVRFNPYGAIKNGESGTITLKNTKNATTTIEISPSGFVKIKK